MEAQLRTLDAPEQATFGVRFAAGRKDAPLTGRAGATGRRCSDSVRRQAVAVGVALRPPGVVMPYLAAYRSAIETRSGT